MTPFIVSSRKSNKLLSKLLSNEYPIFFDGLQSTFISSRKELKNRKKYLRIHNIESIYMKKLSTSEKELVRKVGLKIDSLRYNYFERRLSHFDKIFTISLNDQNFYKNYHKNVYLLSVFHGHQKVKSKEGFGDYIFYHGNFDVSENFKAAMFLTFRSILSKPSDQQYIVSSANTGFAWVPPFIPTITCAFSRPLKLNALTKDIMWPP